MSKKDYIILALALKGSRAAYLTDEAGTALFMHVLQNIIAGLKGDNPRFNPEKFKTYILGE